MENKFIHAALNYVDKGGMKVFPLQPGKKEPYARSKGFKDASDDVMTVTQWWEQEPDSNIGVATGGFFWVLDIDIKSGGIESLDKLLAEHQDGEQLYTFTVKSGGGGYHYYFYYEKDATTGQPKYTVPRSVGKIAPGIDVIAEGSYIIGAFSVTTNRYLPLTDLQDMDTAPDWLLELAINAGTEQLLEDVTDDDGKIPAGMRNESLTTLAGGMRRIGHSSDQLYKMLKLYNEESCVPPLSDREVKRIATSMSKYEPDHNRTKTKTMDMEALDALDTIEKRSYTSDFPPGFMSDWIELLEELSDTPTEFIEIVGLAALGACSPHVHFPTSFSKKGIHTNIYGLIVAKSGKFRKSTAIDFLRDMLDDVLPELEIPAKATPEALIEQIAMRNGKGAIQMHDEWTQQIIEIQKKGYQEGIAGIWMQMFDKRKLIQQRHSKRNSDGEQKVDADRVVDPHFNMLGACTGTIFNALNSEHIESGLLNRFLIAYPQFGRPRKPIGNAVPDQKERLDRLGKYLKDLYEFCNDTKVTCKFSATQLSLLDAFAIEQEDSEETIVQRLNTYAFRLAIIIQLSIALPTGPELIISDYAVKCAINKARMYALQLRIFASEVGGLSTWEMKDEAKMQRILKELETGPRKRSYLSNRLHIQSAAMDKFQATLEDREQLEVTKVKTKGKDAFIWKRL